MKSAVKLSIKVTLLTASFVIVIFSIYYLKRQGISENAQRVLGIHPENREYKARVLDLPVKMPSAPSQETDRNAGKSADNY